MSDNSLGERFFEAYDTYTALEYDVEEALFKVLGVDQYSGKWPFERWTFDSYDRSFELKGAQMDFVPTQDQIDQCLAIGFQRCWICYVDNTERYAAIGYPLGEPKPGADFRNEKSSSGQSNA